MAHTAIGSPRAGDHHMSKPVQQLDRVVIRFAGDSGDGMQLTGDRFTSDAAFHGNDLSTLPNFPAEIRAPQGTIHGVSSFQLHIADHDVLTPGDAPDVLVAMNPAALKANLADLPRGATIIVDTDEFSRRNLAKVGYAVSPLDDGSLESYHVHALPLTSITVDALAEHPLTRKDKERAKNMFALGLLSWLYTRPTSTTERFILSKFARKPDLLAANVAALRAGFAFGETTEDFAHTYQVAAASMPDGTYRNITGNVALSYGLVAAAHQAGLRLVLGSYPITPASDILHTLSGLKRFDVTTMQAEGERPDPLVPRKPFGEQELPTAPVIEHEDDLVERRRIEELTEDRSHPVLAEVGARPHRPAMSTHRQRRHDDSVPAQMRQHVGPLGLRGHRHAVQQHDRRAVPARVDVVDRARIHLDVCHDFP